MEVLLTVTGTRKMPTQISKEDYDKLMDPNTEVKVTLVASPVSFETPIDGVEEQTDAMTIKLKVVHVETIRTTKYTD